MRLTATDTSRHTWSTGASSRLSKDHDTWRDSYGIESEDLSSILDSQVQAERPLPWYLAVSRTRHELFPGSIGEIHFLGANNIRKHQARHVPGYLELSITICSLYVAYLDTIHGASILFVLRDSSARVRNLLKPSLSYLHLINTMLARGATTPDSGALSMSVRWTTLATELVNNILDRSIPRDLHLQITLAAKDNPTSRFWRWGHEDTRLATAAPEAWKSVFALLRISKATRQRTLKSLKCNGCIHVNSEALHNQHVSAFANLDNLRSFGRVEVVKELFRSLWLPVDQGVRVQAKYQVFRSFLDDEAPRGELRVTAAATIPQSGETLTPLNFAWSIRIKESVLSEISAFREHMDNLEEYATRYTIRITDFLDRVEGYDGKTIPPGVKYTELVYLMASHMSGHLPLFGGQNIRNGYQNYTKGLDLGSWENTSLAEMRQLERDLSPIEAFEWPVEVGPAVD